MSDIIWLRDDSTAGPPPPAAVRGGAGLRPHVSTVSDRTLRIVVWGAGAAAADLAARLDPDVDVVAYVDGSGRKAGGTFLGRPVVAPADVAALPDVDRIVIASIFAADICRDLSALGRDLAATPILAWRNAEDGWRYPELFARAPIHVLQVGITTRCNLRCGHCPRVHDATHYSDVPLEAFTRYLSAFDPAQFHTLLVSDFGEVTVVRDFLEYLRVARALGWRRVEFVTNATNGSPRLWDAVFRERLASRIVVSLEGTGSAFETVRDYPWERFSANVRTMTEANRRHDGGAEFVFNAVCMRSNLEALPDVVDFAARHRATLILVHLNPSNIENNLLGLPANHLDRAPRDAVVTTFREVVRRAEALGVHVVLPEEFPELAAPPPATPSTAAAAAPARITGSTTDLLCTQPLRWVEVDGNGLVYPCCQMAKRHPVGDLKRDTFAAIWNGDGYRALLDGLRPGGTPVEVCRTCNMYNGKRF